MKPTSNCNLLGFPSPGLCQTKCRNKKIYTKQEVCINRGFAQRSTHLYVQDFAPLLGFFFVQGGKEKSNKMRYWIHFIKRILNFTWVCVCANILVTQLQFFIMIWTRKVLGHFGVFSNTRLGERKPTWRSQVWCLAKLAWYDVTWKSSMFDRHTTDWQHMMHAVFPNGQPK